MDLLEKGNRVLQLISEGRNKVKTDACQDGANCKQTNSSSRWLDSKQCGESHCKLAKFNCVIGSLNFTLT